MIRLEPKLYLRKDKIDKAGRMPVYIIFPRINGEEPRFSLGRGLRFTMAEWDDAKQLPKDECLRIEIERERERIKREIHLCNLNDKEITKATLKEIVKGYSLSNPKNNSFFQYFDDFLVSKEKVNRIRMSSIKGYITTKNALLRFNPKLCIKDITVENINKFVAYMRQQGIKNGKGEVSQSIRNRLTHIRAVIRYINAKGIDINNPLGMYGVVIPPAKRSDVFLTDKELGKLIKLHRKGNMSKNSTMFKCLEMYLFSCYCGLRISDVISLQWKHVDLEKGLIIKEQVKTKAEVKAPLFDCAKEILRRRLHPKSLLGSEERIFDTYCHTIINDKLKELARIAGINKHLTFHTRRHSFASLITLEEGVPIETISRMLGHTNIQTTQIYARVTPKKLFEDMEGTEKGIKFRDCPPKGLKRKVRQVHRIGFGELLLWRLKYRIWSYDGSGSLRIGLMAPQKAKERTSFSLA